MEMDVPKNLKRKRKEIKVEKELQLHNTICICIGTIVATVELWPNIVDLCYTFSTYPRNITAPSSHFEKEVEDGVIRDN